MTPAKIYPFSIPAGGSFPLLVLGDYCKILTSSGPLSLTGDTFGTLGPILAGQGVEQTPFKRLVLTDNSGATNNGTILIADNKFIDDRITGEVSVIDGGKSRVMTNGAFTAHCFAGAIAAQISGGQLWNPPGSGKKLIIEQIWPTISGYALQIGILNSIITNQSAAVIANKKSGAGGGIALAYNSNNITVLPIIGFAMYTMAPLKNPFIIGPGFGLAFLSPVANVAAGADLEYFEEPL